MGSWPASQKVREGFAVEVSKIKSSKKSSSLPDRRMKDGCVQKRMVMNLLDKQKKVMKERQGFLLMKSSHFLYPLLISPGSTH